MNKRSTFTKPLSYLIVAILAIMAFTSGGLRDWLSIGIFAVAGLWLVIPALRRRAKNRTPRIRRAKRYRPVKGGKPASDGTDSASATLLRHVSHRVSAYLQSAYPDVTWEWVSKHPEKTVAEGGTGRIRLFDIPDYNYADVSFDQMARIHCDFLHVVPYSEATNGTLADGKRPGQPTDPAVWYGIHGKAALEACIADLNSHGFTALMIGENGDVCVKKGDKEFICETLKAFPDKKSWPGLAAVLGREGWTAAVSDTGIAMSW